MKKHVYKYDAIRIVLTMLVVIGHANYYNAGNAYGGIYIADQMSAAGIADTAFHGFAEQIKQLIYTFHMPAFFALSGTLFYSQLKNGRFNSVTEVVKNKISRLVVPFVFVYLFWNTPIKIFSGYYSQSENIWKDILMQMFIPTNMYLWYLEALFFDFVFAYLLCKYAKKTWMINTTSFAVYMAVLFLERATAVTTLFGNPLRYLLWFVFGMNLNKYDKVAKNYLNRFKWGGVLLLAALWIIGYYGLEYLPHLVWLAKDLYLASVGILIVWVICELVSERLTDKEKQLISRLSGYSFGVYLYAEPLNYLFVVLFVKYFGLNFLGNECGACFLWVLRIIGTSLIAVFIVKLLKKTNMKLTLY